MDILNNLTILFTSRNNYELLRIWLDKIRCSFPIYNIDEDSTPEQKALGYAICKHYGVTYLDREERGLQNNLTTISKRTNDWIVWFQHDCYPLGNNFFNQLAIELAWLKLKNVGTVGFNCLNGDEIKRYDKKNNSAPLTRTARTPLEPGDLWYRNKDKWTGTKIKYTEAYNRPFAVEIPAWFAIALNIEKFTEHIIPSSDYHFFHAWDDLCMQFNHKNVYNICHPDFHVHHLQDIKPKFGIPKKSPQNHQKREHYYGKWGHLDIWKSRWGFDYEHRETFEPIKEQYKGTLLWDWYYHNPSLGLPLHTF